jgi:cytochrome c2
MLMGHAGGWAVISVDDLPESAEVGQPLTLSFVVRQHGVTLLDGLRPSIVAKSGDTPVTTQATSLRNGRYAASLTLPRPGDWSVTINSGFGNSAVTLMPLTVRSPGARLTRPVTEANRGRNLFVAKGCATCHEQIAVGPQLTGKRFDATYISRFLANPPQTPSPPSTSAMPNLGLRPREIASLVAYLNSSQQVSAR